VDSANGLRDDRDGCELEAVEPPRALQVAHHGDAVCERDHQDRRREREARGSQNRPEQPRALDDAHYATS
jgi:hypothetical protein